MNISTKLLDIGCARLDQTGHSSYTFGDHDVSSEYHPANCKYILVVAIQGGAP